METRTKSRMDREYEAQADGLPDDLSVTSAVHTSSIESIPDVIDLEVEENLQGCFYDEDDETATPWKGALIHKDKKPKSHANTT